MLLAEFTLYLSHITILLLLFLPHTMTEIVSMVCC